MRVAVIGLGSIGRRHAGILLELGREVIAYDPQPAIRPLAGVMRAGTFDQALDSADAVIIASPSSEHARQARRALELSVPVLVEKPLATDAVRAAELDWLARERGVLLSVAMNMRHLAAVSRLRDLLREEALGRVLRAAAWCGSWLPGWRSGTDYRSAYSARFALGGGVLLDVAVHELDYLLWLLGPAASVTALARRVSNLELDVEDVGLIALELRSGAVAEVVVDYFDRSYHRGCRIVGERATAHWSWERERLTVLGGAEVQEAALPSDVALAYRLQLERFLGAVRGDVEVAVAAGEARHVLSVIDAARSSSREGRRVAPASEIRLRPAERSDSSRLLAWRNDADTRRWSRVQDEVSTDEHRTWLERVLSDPSTSLWIAETEGSPIAQIRVTREGHEAELHVTVAPDARGRGHGSAVIIEAAGRVLADVRVERLLAHVKQDNEASQRAFAHAGFGGLGRDDAGLLRLERKPCR